MAVKKANQIKFAIDKGRLSGSFDRYSSGYQSAPIKRTGKDGVFLNIDDREVLAIINQAIQNMPQISAIGLGMAAENMMAVAVKKTPVDTGNLRGSKYVNPPMILANGPVVEVGYGAEYAPYVHEIDKNYREPGTGWKFLQSAISEQSNNILETIAEAVKRGLA